MCDTNKHETTPVTQIQTDSVSRESSPMTLSPKGSSNILDPINRVAPLPTLSGHIGLSTGDASCSVNTLTNTLPTHVVEDTYMTLGEVRVYPNENQTTEEQKPDELFPASDICQALNDESYHSEQNECRTSTRPTMFPHRKRSSQKLKLSLAAKVDSNEIHSSDPRHSTIERGPL